VGFSPNPGQNQCSFEERLAGCDWQISAAAMASVIEIDQRGSSVDE